MNMTRKAVGLLVSLFVAVGSAYGQDRELGVDLDAYADELLSVSKREPACMVDENGLPKRVIIVRSTGLFERPERGAKRIRTLAAYERLFLYVADPGSGFHRVGVDPFEEGPIGWVPESFAMIWDHDQMLFLSGQDSVPDDVHRIHVWSSAENAREGDPNQAIYSERVERSRGVISDLFFPVLKKDDSGQVYQIGFLYGGDPGTRDEYGAKLTDEERQEIAKNVQVCNVLLVIDSTGSMKPYIAEVQAKTSDAIIDGLAKELVLRSLTVDREKIDLTVKFGLIAFRDRGDEFEVKRVVPLSSDVAAVKTQLASLRAVGGGDMPELVVPALQEAIGAPGLERGALNRIVLIGDSPPHEHTDEVLTELGRRASGRYSQILALVCGNRKITRATFEMIATASGGSVFDVAAAHEVTERILADLKARLAGVPIEKLVIDDALTQDTSIREAAKDLGMTEQQARMVHRLLAARGGDVASSGVGFKTGWVKVRPGTGARFKLHVYTPRWKLAHHLAGLLGLTDRITLRKNLAKDAPAIVRSFLGLEAGEKAAAGLDVEGQTALERAKNVPEVTLGVERGEAGAVRFNRRNKEKILRLLEYWRNASLWEHEYIWLPVELLP